MTTKDKEFEIINHVIKRARYYKEMPDKPYAVHWKGKLYSAQHTDELVLQIKKAEGI